MHIIFVNHEVFAAPTLPDIAYIKDPYDSNIYDTLKFNSTMAPQEFTTTNSGWNMAVALYGGTNYGGTSYATSTVVPGFTDHLIDPAVINMRSGIWRVSISSSNVVTLQFVKTVNLNEYVTVARGSYGGSKLYYDPLIKFDRSVPEYSVLTSALEASYNTTRFDGGGTRFYDHRTGYVLPESRDIYLKFPKVDSYH